MKKFDVSAPYFRFARGSKPVVEFLSSRCRARCCMWEEAEMALLPHASKEIAQIVKPWQPLAKRFSFEKPEAVIQLGTAIKGPKAATM